MKTKQVISLDWLEVRTECLNRALLNGRDYVSGKFVATKQEFGTKFFANKYEVSYKGKAVASLVSAPRARFINEKICLVKLANRVLYTSNWLPLLNSLLSALRLHYKGITRLDVCCDQLRFADGRKPHKFIKDFIAKDCNENGYIHRYGSNNFTINCDKKAGENSRFSYIRFGSRNSAVQAYIYNKSKELRDVKNKPYIVELWEREGLLSSKEDVWRAEISIKSDGLKCVNVRTGELMKINVSDFERELSLQKIFIAYAKKYLRFGVKNGQLLAKDYTPIVLFEQPEDVPIRPYNPSQKMDTGRMEKIIANKLVAMEKEFPNVEGINYESVLDTIHFFYSLSGYKHILYDWRKRKDAYALAYSHGRGLFRQEHFL